MKNIMISSILAATTCFAMIGQASAAPAPQFEKHHVSHAQQHKAPQKVVVKKVATKKVVVKHVKKVATKKVVVKHVTPKKVIVKKIAPKKVVVKNHKPVTKVVYVENHR